MLEDGRTRATNSVEVFSEEKGYWEVGPAMLRKRDFFNLLVIDGRLYASMNISFHRFMVKYCSRW